MPAFNAHPDWPDWLFIGVENGEQPKYELFLTEDKAAEWLAVAVSGPHSRRVFRLDPDNSTEMQLVPPDRPAIRERPRDPWD